MTDAAVLATAFRVLKVRRSAKGAAASPLVATASPRIDRPHPASDLWSARSLAQGAVVKVLRLPTGQSTYHMKFLSAVDGSLGIKLPEAVSGAGRFS
jgi:hypothetical protein